jgi:hypothetical protein
MTTALLVLALLLGLLGTVLGVIALRMCLEVLFHLPGVMEQIRDEQDNFSLRGSRLWTAYRFFHP